jgi:hypothetical protein
MNLNNSRGHFFPETIISYLIKTARLGVALKMVICDKK